MYYLLQLKIIKVLAIHINSGFKVGLTAGRPLRQRAENLVTASE